MTYFKKIRKYLLAPALLTLALLAAPSAVRGAEHTAPELPSANLPELPFYTPDETDTLGGSRAHGVYPARYDSRAQGYVTSVKNQDPWGSCWAFGTLSAGESSMLKKGITGTDIDLSEMHLTYFFFQCPKDPLGLTAGDSLVNQTGNTFMDTGGNNLFTMFALSKWIGPAAESLVPYTSTGPFSESLAYQDTAHMQNARFVNTADRNSVKQLIMDYGAVSTAIYYNPYFQSESGAYLLPLDYAKELATYGISTNTNHIVSIVGWDDQYSRDNFTAVYDGWLMRPSSDGAWIVKNSYGADEGDGGYIYVSYEDASVTRTDGDFLSYAFDLERPDNYDHNYQYDGSFGSGNMTSMNGTSLSNVYTVQANAGGNEMLEAVSFSLYTANVKYSIQIYKNPPAGNPTGGSPVFANPQTGKTTYSGYYTIPLREKPVFAQGDTFAVVITFSSSTSGTVQYFIDQTVTSADLNFVSSSARNQSFYRSDASNGWIDLHTLGQGKTARIKAFTSDTTLPVTKVELITNTLKKPVIKTLKKTGSKKVRLTWKAVKNAAKYQIARSLHKNTGYRVIQTVKGTGCTDKKAAIGAKYYYKIRACRTIKGQPAYSTWSTPKSVTLKLAAPKITTIKSKKKQTRVILKWKKSTGAKGYEIYASATKKNFKKVAAVGAKGSCTIKLKKKKKYFKVRAYTLINGKKKYSVFSGVKKI